jgi:hypothetical protein
MTRTHYVQVDGRLIETFSDRTNAMLEAFDRPQALSDYIARIDAEAPPALVYHYTSGEGLKGILGSGALWFTDIFRLNDPYEIRHGIDAARAHLMGAGARPNASDIEKEFATTVSDALRDKVESSANYFVISCSSEPDHANQWAKYGDNGRGYALGFDTRMLEQHFVGVAPSNHSTFPISYAVDDMENMQRAIVEQALQVVRGVGRHMSAALLRRISVRLSANIIHCAVFFKGPEWASEAEYRLMMVYRGDIAVPGLRTRCGHGTEVRYRVYDWKSSCSAALREIVLGPEADADLAEQLCREIFSSQDLPIRRSALTQL